MNIMFSFPFAISTLLLRLRLQPRRRLSFAAERHPEFLKRPEATTVPLGNDAKFEVVVDGEPKPTVKWYSLTTFFRVNFNTAPASLEISTVLQDVLRLKCQILGHEFRSIKASVANGIWA